MPPLSERLPARRPSTVHQQAVARRLAELADQLAAARAESPARGPDDPHAPHHPRDPDDLDGLDGLDDVDDPDDPPAAGGEWWSGHTRAAAARPALALVPAPSPVAVPRAAAPVPYAEPVVVPHHGRHASRRAWTPSELLPDTLRGQVRLGSPQLTVVALLVALGLAVTAWHVVRDDPSAPLPAAAPAEALVPADPGSDPSGPPVSVLAPSRAASAGATAVAGTPAPSGGRVTVDVAGKVRRPGIVVLPDGARVVDAVKRAGGARAGVDLTTLNLARPLVDGEQILVGVTGGAPAAAPGATSAVPAVPTAPAAPVDLNTATEAELESLPDVGPVTAASILSWRTAHGGFTAVTELLEVDGIGDATLAKLTPLVTV